MGRYGGHETGYGSDADVVFVHDPRPGLDPAGDREASDAAQAVAIEMTRLLELPAPDPPLVLDASLRPEGRQGPLVRSLAACRKYYASRSAPWEYQALLRAEFAVGDASLGADFMAIADEYRYPRGRPAEPRRAGRSAGSRRGSRPSASRAAPTGPCTSSWGRAGCRTSSGPSSCSSCSTARRSRDCARRRPSTRWAPPSTPAWRAPPTPPRWPRPGSWRPGYGTRSCWCAVAPMTRCRPATRELTAVARLLGYRPAGEHRDRPGGPLAASDPGQALEDDYRRTARRARAVMERLFFG